MRAVLLAGAMLAALPAAVIAGAAFAQPSAAASSAAPSAADARLKALYEADWAWTKADRQQVKAGDRWVAGDRLPDVSPAAQQTRIAHWRETMAKLEAIPVAELSAEEKLNAAVLHEVLRANIASAPFHTWEMPFNSDSNFWSGLARADDGADAAALTRAVARMRDIPRYFDQQIANMRAGLKRGFSVPRATLAGRADSIAPYAETDPEKNPFYDSFRTLPATMPTAEQDRLRADAKAAISQAVAPAYAKLLAFIRDEYAPKARTTLAAEAMPDGKAFYAAQIKEYTTLDLNAEQIHEIGLKEVARIEAEMRDTMVRSGFKGDFPAYLKFLKTDPQFIAKTPDELMGVSAYVAKRADGKLAEQIGTLPRFRFTIIPVPDAIAPFYTAGRGGLKACMMNTYDLPSRPLYNIPALTLHECAPGHSFQAALALEQPADRPEFRRATYFSGYGEGWGLYTEWLGREMGIYRNPYEEFGQLSYAMWRAVRLVIDTGVHHYGWSRDKAIAYLADHTALSQHEVETEVDRYISWPGQALAYKLGELTIRRLRAKAEAELGAKFDKRTFHDAILSTGALPLPVLEQQIDEYIAREKARA
ncbi:DUF885 domain-containing protein [Sphingomonas flavalba]|uniref:DUF885 domain-containing protein n=1 Tax=Sphingomonas flavalba TaxID=2559804 RepID=UPI00109DEB5D|nr:DUF885 family protein [Sphingomonas flavalba]